MKEKKRVYRFDTRARTPPPHKKMSKFDDVPVEENTPCISSVKHPKVKLIVFTYPTNSCGPSFNRFPVLERFCKNNNLFVAYYIVDDEFPLKTHIKEEVRKGEFWAIFTQEGTNITELSIVYRSIEGIDLVVWENKEFKYSWFGCKIISDTEKVDRKEVKKRMNFADRKAEF